MVKFLIFFFGKSICRIFKILPLVIIFSLLHISKADAALHGMVETGWEDHVQKAIFKIADTDFEDGLRMLDQYIKAFPENPGGYFYYAAGVQEKIQKRNDLSDLKRFYRYAKKSQKLSRKRLRKNPDDSVARLFLGCMDGYIGLLEARQRHLFRAFKNGIEAKGHLQKVIEKNPEIPDTYFALGMLYYFSSKKSREEKWPVSWIIRKFITKGKDMRQDGINMINHALKHNAISKDYARSVLMWIYLYEADYGKAGKLALKTAELFPRDTMARWVLGRIALNNRDCQKAEFWFEEISRINKMMDLPISRFRDVEIAKKKSKLCARMKEKDFGQAAILHEEISAWLNSRPKLTLEYQDEKKLIKKWEEESREISAALKTLNGFSQIKKNK